jgi:hypothetical protein
MIPAPGETPAEWWDKTGYRQAVQEQARRDGGLTGNEDPSSSSTTTCPAPLPRRR